MEEVTGKRIRKRPKRADEVDYVGVAQPTPSLVTARSRGQSFVSAPSSEPDTNPDHLDAVASDDGGDLEDQPPPPPPVRGAARGKGKRRMTMTEDAVAPPPVPKKKARRVVESEDEGDDGADDYAKGMEERALEAQDDDDDDAFEPPPPVKARGKAGAASRGKKRGKADVGDSGAEAAPAPKRIRPLKNQAANLVIDVVGDGDDATTESRAASAQASTPHAVKHDSPAPTAKKKLPTIKKTKGAAGTSGPKRPVDIPGTTGKATQDEIRQKMTMATDLDLSNKSIYEELFKGASGPGGAPRPGISRRTREEERRKELDQMREEYKAKLAEEAVHTFDLQASMDRISRFEERLREQQSAAVYPNFLAAKWREIWEKERRREREQFSYSRGSNEPRVVEEGEVE